jgi:excisionase family DNA binding protein
VRHSFTSDITVAPHRELRKFPDTRVRKSMENELLPRLHTIAAVSQRTSLSRSALYREIAAGRLHALKVGRSLRFSESEIQRFISSIEKGGS